MRSEMTRPRTESPRNSMRSLEARRESVTEAWVRAWARRAGVANWWLMAVWMAAKASGEIVGVGSDGVTRRGGLVSRRRDEGGEPALSSASARLSAGAPGDAFFRGGEGMAPLVEAGAASAGADVVSADGAGLARLDLARFGRGGVSEGIHGPCDG